MLPELGGDRFASHISEILNAFELIGKQLAQNPPEAIMICSPHYQDQVFEVGLARSYRGSLEGFQRPDVVDHRQGHPELGAHIQARAEDIGFVAAREAEEEADIDYGTVVPLRLIDPHARIPIVPVSVSMGSKKEHYLWGRQLA